MARLRMSDSRDRPRVPLTAMTSRPRRRSSGEPVEALEHSIKTLTPVLEVRSRRVGGATYQVPVEVPARRARTLAVRWLVEARDVHGFGTETIGTDAGQGGHFNPPYPAHHFMHGRGRYGLQCLANLDQLPATGALLLAAPLKIRQGSGSPLRVLALVEA